MISRLRVSSPPNNFMSRRLDKKEGGAVTHFHGLCALVLLLQLDNKLHRPDER